MSDNRKSNDLEKFLETARKRFQLASDAEQEARRAALDDLNFRVGEQWPEHILREREADSRPCLTINRLPQFLRSVCNEQRQNRPAIQISPVDDDGDPETAEVLQGLTRHIEQQSDAEIAYDTAFEHAATCGFPGWIRVRNDYAGADSFEQEIYIESIENPFTVYSDPAAKKADRADMQFAFIVDDLSEDDFKAQFPDSELCGLPDFSSLGDRVPGWFTNGSVRIAEYFCVEYEKRVLLQLADGNTAFADELEDGQAVVVKKRVVEFPRVKWAKINAVEILEEADIPGTSIPLIPVFGEMLNVDGKRQYVGIIRYAKDAQRAYNYWTTAETEMIALAPRAPYIGVEGQFEGHEHQWAAANVSNLPYLEYKAKSVGGELVGAPQRQSYEPPIQAISIARQQAVEDLKATTGIYDPSLGVNRHDQSGRAILALQQEGDTANFHLVDNLARAIRRVGRIVLEHIRVVYDTPRVRRILGEDNQAKTVTLNAPFAEGGVQKVFDVTTGRYDVTVAVGPSYHSKRQQAVEAMLELTKAYPQLAEIAGDLMVSNMDWPGAKQIAERLKRMLPPALQDSDGKQAPLPPQIQAVLHQLTEQNGALTQALNEATKLLEQQQIEAASRFEIAKMQEETKRTIALANIDSREGIEELRHKVAAIYNAHSTALESAKLLTAHESQQQQFEAQQQQQQQQQAMPEAA